MIYLLSLNYLPFKTPGLRVNITENRQARFKNRRFGWYSRLELRREINSQPSQGHPPTNKSSPQYNILSVASAIHPPGPQTPPRSCTYKMRFLYPIRVQMPSRLLLYLAAVALEQAVVATRAQPLINHALRIAHLLPFRDLPGSRFQVHLLAPPRRQSSRWRPRGKAREATPHDCWLLLERLRRAREPVEM